MKILTTLFGFAKKNKEISTLKDEINKNRDSGIQELKKLNKKVKLLLSEGQIEIVIKGVHGMIVADSKKK